MILHSLDKRFQCTLIMSIIEFLITVMYTNGGGYICSSAMHFSEIEGRPSILENLPNRGWWLELWAFLGGKNPKKVLPIFLRPPHIYKKYFLQKNWVKTAIPALSSGQSNLHPPIWGRHRQLDDHHRNPNINYRDHLVGQLTTHSQDFCDLTK